MSYPKYVYHKKEGAKLIHSEKEEHEEWLDNPGMHLPESHVEHVKPVKKQTYVEPVESEEDEGKKKKKKAE